MEELYVYANDESNVVKLLTVVRRHRTPYGNRCKIHYTTKLLYIYFPNRLSYLHEKFHIKKL